MENEIKITTITDNDEWETGATEHSVRLQQRIDELETKINRLEKILEKILEKMKEVYSKYERHTRTD